MTPTQIRVTYKRDFFNGEDAEVTLIAEVDHDGVDYGKYLGDLAVELLAEAKAALHAELPIRKGNNS